MKPFVKCVGGKTRLLPDLLGQIPQNGWDAYCEPFVGGGALFWELAGRGLLDNKEIILADLNSGLIDLYRAIGGSNFTTIQEELDLLVAAYERMSLEKREQLYYWQRNRWNHGYHHSATFMFLSQTSYNGLWRENKKGSMNAPWGKYKRVSVPTGGDWEVGHRVLGWRNSESVIYADFRETCEILKVNSRKWLIYFDPPYHNMFSGYTAKPFKQRDQEEVVAWCRRLDDLGFFVIYSNALGMADAVAQMWPAAWAFHVSGRRSISCRASGRIRQPELLVIGKALQEKLNGVTLRSA